MGIKTTMQSSRQRFNWGTAVETLPLGVKKQLGKVKKDSKLLNILLHIKAAFDSFCRVFDISYQVKANIYNFGFTRVTFCVNSSLPILTSLTKMHRLIGQFSDNLTPLKHCTLRFISSRKIGLDMKFCGVFQFHPL